VYIKKAVLEISLTALISEQEQCVILKNIKLLHNYWSSEVKNVFTSQET